MYSIPLPTLSCDAARSDAMPPWLATSQLHQVATVLPRSCACNSGLQQEPQDPAAWLDAPAPPIEDGDDDWVVCDGATASREDWVLVLQNGWTQEGDAEQPSSFRSQTTSPPPPGPRDWKQGEKVWVWENRQWLPGAQI